MLRVVIDFCIQYARDSIHTYTYSVIFLTYVNLYQMSVKCKNHSV